MSQQICIFLLFLATSAYAQSVDLKKMSKLERYSYLSDCRKMILETQHGRDAKDINMMCSDPYLVGTLDESEADKTRRLRLKQEMNEAKKAAMKTFIATHVVTRSMEDCKKAFLEEDPGKDSADIKLHCKDPYLEGKPGETYEDQVRRKRLKKEAESKNSAVPVSPVVPEVVPNR